MAVASIQKPVKQWCVHCDTSSGCLIYEDRPAECRTFNCLWLGSDNEWQKLLADCKPDKVKFLLTWEEDIQSIVVHPDPGYPHQWLEKLSVLVPIGNQLSLVVVSGKKVLGIGSKSQEKYGVVDENL